MKIMHIPSVWEQKKEQLKLDRQTRRRLVNDGYRIDFLIQMRGGEKPEIVEQRERERKVKPFGKMLEPDCCTRERMKKLRGERYETDYI